MEVIDSTSSFHISLSSERKICKSISIFTSIKALYITGNYCFVYIFYFYYIQDGITVDYTQLVQFHNVLLVLRY